MKVFLDTSSLLKLYHHEVGTEKLLNTLSQGIEEIYLSKKEDAGASSRHDHAGAQSQENKIIILCRLG